MAVPVHNMQRIVFAKMLPLNDDARENRARCSHELVNEILIFPAAQSPLRPTEVERVVQ